ncbi:Insect cuticle protein,Chitin-binding type R&R consensus [Cinara cedri]|uniref:Insect cuticle protein,Chitin-binding type R&R consensus n=1 Tax=Cinara cedri TaxID=506608 RepID=A0A5E4M612_9HEMI|nr:Insect cuticle protein,Chitin-binding type R&R consensus [Cinara cedri]
MAAIIKICSAVAVVVVACACLTAGYPFATSSSAPLSYPEDDHQQQQQNKAYEFQQLDQHDESNSDTDAVSAPRTYHFQYAVNDPATGDVKSQNEVGDGHGGVRGHYSLVEPDGSTRVVEYAADDVNGFTAEVKRIEPQHKAEETAGYEIEKSVELQPEDGAAHQSDGNEAQSAYQDEGAEAYDGDHSELYSPR